jgi:hypothetical protein
MKKSILLGAICAAALAGPVLAQTEVEHTTVVEHRSSDNVVAAPPPEEVRTYVIRRTERPVAYEGEIVVGHPIHGDIHWMDIPDEPKYRWAYLGDKRVVIDTDTNDVVAVY